MPGRHTAKQKRQAKHIAESERTRGVDPKRAESIGWATVNKQKSVEKGPGFKPTPIASRTSGAKKPIDIEIGPATVTTLPKKPVSLDIGPATVTTMPKQKPVTLDIGPATVTPVPKQKPTMVARKAVTPQEAEFREMTEKLKRRAGQTRKRPFGRRGITAFGKARTETMGKSFQVMSIGDYYDSVIKAEGGPPAPAAPGAALPKPKKFPRKEKPTVKMKPISDQEAVTNLRAGKYHEKSLVMLAAIKALVSGYGKVSGGGALRAPNRGFPTVGDLQRAMEVMPKPKSVSKKPTIKLPGVHGPETEFAKKPPPIPKKKTSPIEHVMGAANKGDYASSMEEPTLKKQKNVVHKAEGDASMSKTNFNDLFKSELGVANDDVLVDCPHCEAPITKSDLAKAHKGKGSATNVSGPKTAGGNLRSQNPEGGTMRGGDGKGQVTSSRGVPGAQKTDVVAGVQNSKGSKTHKAMDDESSCADDVSSAGAASSKAKKSMGSVRGTDFVQYWDYGDAPGSDASIAKSIAEAQGALGQQATQPMDLNNDLSRLLV